MPTEWLDASVFCEHAFSFLFSKNVIVHYNVLLSEEVSPVVLISLTTPWVMLPLGDTLFPQVLAKYY